MDINAILLALGVLGALGIIFGVVLGVADKKFAVKTDPRVEAIRAWPWRRKLRSLRLCWL